MNSGFKFCKSAVALVLEMGVYCCVSSVYLAGRYQIETEERLLEKHTAREEWPENRTLRYTAMEK
jgi:hypothetical protein